MSKESNAIKLTLRLYFLALFMRKMPKNIRKTLWWWTQLYSKIGGGGFSADTSVDNQWPPGFQQPISSPNGYLLRLELKNWMERRAYFSGTYYQTDLTDLITKITRSGDQFIDIGANIGFITLHASQLVGTKGKVISFEPNPAMQARLHDHIKLNQLSPSVTVIEAALGETPSSAVLHVPEDHPGMGTLTSHEGTAIEVPVVKGDDVLPMISKDTPLIIKIDVEGFEQKALSGLQQTLEHPNIILIIEITDSMLNRVGDSANGLYEFLKTKGFEVYQFKTEQKRFNRSLDIYPSNEVLDLEQYDAIFVRPKSQIMNRLL
jgi:FkbM family methyltransferase